MNQGQLDEELDTVLDDLESDRQRAPAYVLAWLDHATADRLGLDASHLSRDDYEDLRMDLLEVFLAGAIADRLGWTVVEDR